MATGSAEADSVSDTAPSVTSSPAQSAGPRSWAPTPAAGPRPKMAPDQPRRFAVQEAVRLAREGASTQGAAYDVLRWASRQRTVIEAALDEVRADATIDASTRDAAAEILERVLTVGFLY
jgi:hypothetical protein